jgi:hypothetical protein
MVMLTLAAYASVREGRYRFVLLLGHENVAKVRVVADEGGQDYVVVEKHANPAQ